MFLYAGSGVVTGADFEEVNQESRTRGGYQQRTKNQQKREDRLVHHQSAIEANLYMSSYFEYENINIRYIDQTDRRLSYTIILTLPFV